MSKINMRVGPSEAYRIEWVYERPSLPLKVLRIKEGWRLVQDADGDKGWVVARFLTRDRTAIVIGEGDAPMRAEPSRLSPLLWNVEPGVVGKLGDCETGWCRLDVTGRVGWMPQDRLWGPGEP
ncbi:SH3 domain-containing protein [Croceicoccus estronivorus]|uniref:SH3 domain-containing protein n=1 Tax=Croceicoccus estronivorus TaxID=1172626 RepID=UPI001EFF3E3C|nr:SH3 domain-containing protein [Croceicoccus estronivorus]